MAKVILVHGMRATKHSWFNIPTRLEAHYNGVHDVSAITLTGHDDGKLGATMDDYLSDIEAATGGGDGLTLIGHSMGGAVISHFASANPARVKRLIYVAAMLPQDGDTIAGMSAKFGTSLEDIDLEFEEAGIEENDPAIGNQPLLPFMAPFQPGNSFGDIRKFYIRCLNDRIIPSDHQKAMATAWGVVPTEIDTGHLPQKTAEDELFGQLKAAIDTA